MQNEIMDAVTRKIFEIFGDGYTIYTDNVKQDLKEPCFFVSFLEPSHKPLLGKRYRRIYDMSIQYFPVGEDLSREMNQIVDRLIEGLEYISLPDGSLRRGMDMSGRISDDILTFLVTYDMFGLKPEKEKEPMEALTVKGVSR